MPSQKSMRSCSPGGGNTGASFSSIARQPSIYGFSSGELQKSEGKSLAMEDLGKNVWTAEEGGKAMAHASMHPHSNLSLLRTVSGKSMEDIWKQIQPRSRAIDNKQHNPEQQQQQHRPGNMGEMTLEDFLVKAGVVKEDADAKADLSLYPGNPNLHPVALQDSELQADWMMNHASQQQHQHLLQQADAAPALARGANLMFPGHHDGSGPGPGPDGLALVTSVSDCPILCRKRGAAPHAMESSMQRRQKRMIKNRESAARSRARRQAYTVELEAEVTQLKEENARLKKLQVLENCPPKNNNNPESPTHVLRRTQSW